MMYPPRNSLRTKRYGRKGGAVRVTRTLLMLGALALVAAAFWLVVWVKQNRGAKMGARPLGDDAATSVPSFPAEFVPPFKAFTFEGKSFSIASYEDTSAVVLDFWASWCEACGNDMPRLQAAAAHYGENKVTLIGIHRGDTEPAERGIAFAAKLGIEHLLLQDSEGKLFALLGQGKPFMPLTLFIDRQGRIVDRRIGPKTDEEIRVSMAKIAAP